MGNIFPFHNFGPIILAMTWVLKIVCDHIYEIFALVYHLDT